MKIINEHIKTREFKNIYLIYGPEGYLRKQAKDKLHTALIDPADTMNYSYFDGKKIDSAEIVSLGQTLPFFSDYRLIILENTNVFANPTDELLTFLKEIPETTCLIFVEEDVDKRSRLYKLINQIGYAAYMDFLDEKSLITWIASLVKKEGKQITDRAIRLFISKIGTDMDQVKNELEKLFSYTLNRDSIVEEDVEAVVTTITTSKIFDMINAIAIGRQKAALELYYDLLELKEPPMRILALLTRQFNLTMQVKDLERQHFLAGDMGKKVGLSPYVVKKYLEQARHFSLERLDEMLRSCLWTEEAVKTGQMNDKIGIELLIVEFSCRI